MNKKKALENVQGLLRWPPIDLLAPEPRRKKPLRIAVKGRQQNRGFHVHRDFPLSRWSAGVFVAEKARFRELSVVALAGSVARVDIFGIQMHRVVSVGSGVDVNDRENQADPQGRVEHQEGSQHRLALQGKKGLAGDALPLQ